MFLIGHSYKDKVKCMNHIIVPLSHKEILSQLTQVKINYYVINMMNGKIQPLFISHRKEAIK